MSKINLNNYEAYVLDFMEENLSEEDIQALKIFALIHPQLEINLNEQLLVLENSTIFYNEKNNLKARFTEDLVIGYLENKLSEKEKQLAEELALTNLPFNKELALYKKTIAQPELTVVFKNKAQLKRSSKTISLFQSIQFKVAAAIVFVFGLWFLISQLAYLPTKNTTLTVKPIEKPKNQTPINALNSNLFTKVNNTPEATVLVNKKTKRNSYKTIKTQTVVTKESEILESTQYENIAVLNNKEEALIQNVDSNEVQLAKQLQKEQMKTKYIIEEVNEDESLVSTSKKKNKLLYSASKMFKLLHQKGIQKLNASENNNELFIGALSISKAD